MLRLTSTYTCILRVRREVGEPSVTGRVDSEMLVMIKECEGGAKPVVVQYGG